MADILWTDVTDIASELLTGVTVNGQVRILGYVNDKVNPASFGGVDSDDFFLARVYLAAHYGALSKFGSSFKGPVLSQSEGGVSQSFANMMAMSKSPFLESTVWGRAFLTLVSYSPGRAGFTT